MTGKNTVKNVKVFEWISNFTLTSNTIAWKIKTPLRRSEPEMVWLLLSIVLSFNSYASPDDSSSVENVRKSRTQPCQIAWE